MKYIIILLLLPVQLIGQNVKLLNGAYSQAVYSTSDAHIYAQNSIFNGTAYENFIEKIDPQTAKVISQIPLSEAIAGLEISDDGSYLYCLLFQSIERYNFSTSSFDLSIVNDFGGGTPLQPRTLVPLPNQPESFAVLWESAFSSSAFSISIYDGSIKRPSIVEEPRSIRDMSISEDGSKLYGYNSRNTGHELYIMDVQSDGLEISPYTYAYSQGFTTSIKPYEGKIYGSDGIVTDVADFPAKKIGRLVGGPGYGPNFTILEETHSSDTIFAIGERGGNYTAFWFDKANFQLLHKRDLGYYELFSPLDKVIQWGSEEHIAILYADGLAFIQNCVPAVSTPVDFVNPLLYYCNSSPFELEAPGNYPPNSYFWSDGSQGKIYNSTFVGQQFPIELSYQISDANGCLSAFSAPITIKSNYLGSPAAPYSEYFTTEMCQGGYMDLYPGNWNPQAVTGKKFIWSTGDTTNILRIENTGNYTYRILNYDGCLSPESAPISIIDAGIATPSKPNITVISGDGDTDMCINENPTLKAPTGYQTYRWDDDFISLEERQIYEEKTYRLQVVNDKGCASPCSDALTVDFIEIPEKPSVIRLNNRLSSSSTIGNQWFKNGELIAGATNQNYVMSEPGIYSVIVYNQGECASEESEPVHY